MWRAPEAATFKPFKCHILTIRVQLVSVGCQSAVVPVVRYAIIIIIIVTCVSFAILVVVSLVGVGHVGTVVQVVLMAVFIDVLVIVTLISNQVIVYVSLLDKYRQRLTVLTLSVPTVLECVIICIYTVCGSVPGQGCAAMDSCHTGHQLHPCQCPSGQCCTHRGNCLARSEFLRKKGQLMTFS